MLGAILDDITDINHGHAVTASWLTHLPHLLPLALALVPLKDVIKTYIPIWPISTSATYIL